MPRKGMRLIGMIGLSPKRSSGEFSSSTEPSFSVSVMERTLEISEPVIMRWNSEALTSLFYESRGEATEFVKCVKNLQKAMQFLAKEKTRSEKLIRAQSLMEVAMKRLQKELFQILSVNRADLDPESVSSRSSVSTDLSSASDFDVEEDDDNGGDSVLSSAVIADLRLIVECMISCGYTKECLRVYTDIRKSIVDKAIERLGIDKLSSSQTKKMDWEVMSGKIKNWLSGIGFAVNTLFNGEKILCDNVFVSSSESVRGLVFKEITRESAMALFELPEIMAKNSRNSPEKVLSLLEMYSAIANLWPRIESIFSSEIVSEIRSQAVTSLIKLGDSVRSGLEQFETVLQKNSSKTPVSGAGIHSITIDSMSFLTSISNYTNVLADILAGAPPVMPEKFPKSYFSTESDELPAISLRFAWLILLLLCKLDAIADHYKEISSAYLFLANNLQHVVVNVQSSELSHLLGSSWLSTQSAKVKLYTANYERLGWGDVISSIPQNPTADMPYEEVKQHFKRFNASFEQAHRKHSACVVPDRDLRDHLKESLAAKIIPVYRNFYDMHKITMARNKHFACVVKFAPEDVGHGLSDLFFEPVESRSILSSARLRLFSSR